jgi:proliferating cell nuclear antigen PCNA
MDNSALIETNRGDVLSGFHEAVRDFSREARLVFTPSGVRLYGRDSAKVVLVQYFLPADEICASGQGKYKCDVECIEVGIDTKIVANCLSSVACGDLVGLSVNMDEEPDRLIIRCQNPISGKRSRYDVIIPEILDDPIDRNPIESCGYNSEITMSSLLFHDMIRDLTKSDSPSVRVCCDGKRLVMFANGRHIKAVFEVKVGTDSSRFTYNPKKEDRWPVCECFSINFLQKVSKAKGVAQNISIFLQPNFPIAFAYKTDIGSLSFMITPRDDEEWTENPESRIMPDTSDDISGIVPRQRSNGSKKRQTSKDDEVTSAGGDSDKEDCLKNASDEEESRPLKKKRK